MRLLFQYVQHALLLLMFTIYLRCLCSGAIFGHLHYWEMQDSAHFIDCLIEFSLTLFSTDIRIRKSRLCN